MIDTTNDAAAQALLLLNEKLHHWRNGPEPVWNSTWPVFERLISQHDQMKTVYIELAAKKVTGQRLWVLLEQCIFSGGFGTAGHYAVLRADHLELQALCEEISVTSIWLAQRLRRRSEILNRSCSFSIDRRVRLTDYIDEAGSGNGLYSMYIQPKLEELNNFDLKYWPDIADLLQVMGEESAEVKCLDDATEAIIGARRASSTDFFKQFFSRLHTISHDVPWGLPSGFRLSDSAIATLANIICDRLPDQKIDEGHVKRLRQRLREQGFTAVW